MSSMALLAAVTLLYAGYNIFIKVSGDHVPTAATTTIVATICLQLAALATSLCFAAILLTAGGQDFRLTKPAYLWAAASGVCIGLAEIGYLYLFAGFGTAGPVAASFAIPVIVAGTLLVTGLVALVVFREAMSLTQILGLVVIGVGVLMLASGRNGV